MLLCATAWRAACAFCFVMYSTVCACVAYLSASICTTSLPGVRPIVVWLTSGVNEITGAGPAHKRTRARDVALATMTLALIYCTQPWRAALSLVLLIPAWRMQIAIFFSQRQCYNKLLIKVCRGMRRLISHPAPQQRQWPPPCPYICSNKLRPTCISAPLP